MWLAVLECCVMWCVPIVVVAGVRMANIGVGRE